MPFGAQVLPPGEPLPDRSENECVWSGCVEIRKSLRNGTVSYTTEFRYERGDNRITELVHKRLSELAMQLPEQFPK